jgi:hypothetical protein
MQISDDVARAEILSFFKVRAEDKQINNVEEYEKHLYKVIVQHLNVFSGEDLLEQEIVKAKYELENRLPLICRELISLERYRGIRKLRRRVS